MRVALTSAVLLVLALQKGQSLKAVQCGKPVFLPGPTGGLTRIINGQEAVPHSFPWMASITAGQPDHYCGAAIVASKWILTAAHCAKLVFIGTYSGDKVLLGQHDREATEPGKQEIKIEEVYIHPNYEKPSEPKRSFDVALLRLKDEAVFSETVMPICLPDLGDFGDSSTFPAGMECILTGWGSTPGESYPSDMYGQPYKLRQAVLPLVDDTSCEQIYLEGADFPIQPSMQCAGGNGKTSCNGDSGGPLVCKKDELWYQVGIVSFGPAPCDGEIPAVYTRVAAYTDWINETIEANGGL